jgi:hypothetical protein
MEMYIRNQKPIVKNKGKSVRKSETQIHGSGSHRDTIAGFL